MCSTQFLQQPQIASLYTVAYLAGASASKREALAVLSARPLAVRRSHSRREIISPPRSRKAVRAGACDGSARTSLSGQHNKRGRSVGLPVIRLRSPGRSSSEPGRCAPSGGSARLDALTSRRGGPSKVSVLKEVRIPGEQEPAAVTRDTELRDVLRPNRREASDGLVTIADDGLEEEFDFALAEQNPRVSAVLRSRWDTAPDDEVG